MRLVIAHFALLLAATCLRAQPDDGMLEQGRRIYQQGITIDGRPLGATSAGGARLGGQQAACMSCHRRSGMGSREGSVTDSPVAGPVLYTKREAYWPKRPGREAQHVAPLRQDSRDAYDDASLARAVREGVDPNGRQLDALMPRYELGDADAKALNAYLRGLSAARVPGLEGGILHLATIVTADADPLRAKVVTDTLTTWSRSGALGGIALDLQVWKLEGPANGWERQLRDHHAHRPVYAVISGAGRSQWAPVRNFCEQLALPCLFPIVDLAPNDAADFYTLYFSRGVPLEAHMLARHLDELAPRPARVVQLVADDAGKAAARLLAADLGSAAIETRVWHAGSPARAVKDMKPDDVLVAWLRPEQLLRLTEARPQGLGVAQVLISAQLAPPEKTALPLAWRREARWVSARSDPRRVQGKGVLGLVPWASHMKLSLNEEALTAEVYAATYFFGDALARMRGHWNREFLLETLESAHYARPAGSAFFSLSLGPGQREAAKAGHLLGFDGPDYVQLTTVGPRLAP